MYCLRKEAWCTLFLSSKKMLSSKAEATEEALPQTIIHALQELKTLEMINMLKMLVQSDVKKTQ